METYQEKYSFTQVVNLFNYVLNFKDYIEATAHKYRDKIKKGVDFIQYDGQSLIDCVNSLSENRASDLRVSFLALKL